MTAPATGPLVAPLFERTAPLPVPRRGGRHRAPSRTRRRLGHALLGVALALATRRAPETR